MKRLLLTLTLALAAASAAAQSTVPALLLSDIHFDPFRDPAKVAALQTAPAEAWPKILAAPLTATQAVDFQKLTLACPQRGLDTDFALLESSLEAARHQLAKPAFLTVTGDFLAHGFECRFAALGGKPEALPAFAAKTVSFVALQLRSAFPGVPIIASLGNNDSGCGDYRDDLGSPFLAATAKALAPPSAQTEASRLGDWSAPLPRPFTKARVLVLQDIFESSKYATCAGKRDPAPAAEQIAWLRAQLTAARAHGEHVWVVGHVPPGVDGYATVMRGHDVCKGDRAVMFTGTDDLAHALTDFADTITLALFAHTHMDEIHTVGTGDHTVALKLVPSISPVNGNRPAFTLANIDPTTFTLADYAVFVAPNLAGAGPWHEEYRFSATFHQPAFTAATAAKIVTSFRADLNSQQETTRLYEDHFFAGDEGKRGMLLRLAWPAYACTAAATTADDYRNCTCTPDK